jgi:predicted nucleotidyltransferase
VDKITHRLKDNYEKVQDMGYEVVGVFLQGSQNYELDYEDSDIDCKAIVLPSFENIILNTKPVSTTIVLENNEHIDLKDIRLMFDCFKKQNINFVEILFTKYKLINPKYESIIQPLFYNNEMIARYNNYDAVKCMSGMSMEKYKALEHPYPATKDKIEKYGYDPKQLHHIIRINEFIKRYINGTPYRHCLISLQKDYLIAVKKGKHTLEEAREIAKRMNEETIKIREDYMKNNKVLIVNDVYNLLNNIIVDVMKLNFKCK